MSECVLKALACQGLRVSPSKVLHQETYQRLMGRTSSHKPQLLSPETVRSGGLHMKGWGFKILLHVVAVE